MNHQALDRLSVLVSRSGERNRELRVALESRGATVHEYGILRVSPPDDTSELDRALGQLELFDWVIFTSVNAVEAVTNRLSLLANQGMTGEMAVTAIGESTARCARAAGWEVSVIPSRADSKGLIEAMGPNRPGRVLLPHSNLAAQDIENGLREAGFDVTTAIAYRTETDPTELGDAKRCIREGRADVALLTSPSTVSALGQDLRESQATRLVALGQTTASSLREAGVEPDATARTPSVQHVVEALLAAVGRVV